MDDQRAGAAFRAIRIRRGWRQEDAAQAAAVSHTTISRIERGHFASLALGTARRVAAVLDLRLDLVARWRGGELDRLLNAGHSAMHERFARLVRSADGWSFVPEVSFSIAGERGVIDVAGWHPATKTLLVIELKTVVVDVQEIVGSMHRRQRLADPIAQQQGWKPEAVGAWLILAEGTTNRRRVAADGELLRTAFPADGRQIRRWLERPGGPIAALSFLPNDHPRNAGPVVAGRQRVRRRVSPVATHEGRMRRTDVPR